MKPELLRETAKMGKVQSEPGTSCDRKQWIVQRLTGSCQEHNMNSNGNTY